MAACNLHTRISIDYTRRLQPLTRRIGEVTRTAAEHIAIEGMAVGSYKSAS